MNLNHPLVCFGFITVMTMQSLVSQDITDVSALSLERVLNPNNSLKVSSVRAYGRIKVGADDSAYFRGEGTADEAERLLRVAREIDWRRDDSIKEGGAFQSLHYCFISFRLPTGEVELICIGGRVLIVKAGKDEAWYAYPGEPATAETFETASVMEQFLLEKRAGWKTLSKPVEDGWFFKGFGRK